MVEASMTDKELIEWFEKHGHSFGFKSHVREKFRLAATRLSALSRPADALTEREAVVAWWRGQLDPVERYDYRTNRLIESIERGEHIPALTKDGE